jgi:hypothetical protein
VLQENWIPTFKIPKLDSLSLALYKSQYEMKQRPWLNHLNTETTRGNHMLDVGTGKKFLNKTLVAQEMNINKKNLLI